MGERGHGTVEQRHADACRAVAEARMRLLAAEQAREAVEIELSGGSRWSVPRPVPTEAHVVQAARQFPNGAASAELVNAVAALGFHETTVPPVIVRALDKGSIVLGQGMSLFPAAGPAQAA